MALSPTTMKVTNDALADELAKAGQRLIELSMQLRSGFDVPVNYVKAQIKCTCDTRKTSSETHRLSCEVMRAALRAAGGAL